MGGRGVSSYSDRGARRFGNGLGTKVDDTLGEALGMRGKPQGIGQASRGANPHYSSAFSEYSENCQRAVVAYELRRRGYDVVAQPTYRSDTMGRVVHVDSRKGTYHSRWSGAFRGAKPENVGGRTGSKMIDRLDSKMASYGEGARAVVQVQWKKGGGHVFVAERKNGRTVYIDPQVNKRYTANYIASSVRPGSVNLVRTDNLRVSERAKNSVTHRKY